MRKLEKDGRKSSQVGVCVFSRDGWIDGKFVLHVYFINVFMSSLVDLIVRCLVSSR